MSNFLPGDEAKTIYLAGGGNDDNTGLNSTFAKKTMASARAAAIALNPLITDPVSIVSSTAITLLESLVLVDGLNLNAPQLRLQTLSGTTLTVASSINVELFQVVPFGINAVGVDVSDVTGADLNISFIVCSSTDQIGLKVSGTVDFLFGNISEIFLNFPNAIGIECTAVTSLGANVIQSSHIQLSSTNGKALVYNSAGSDPSVINIDSITGSSTGAIALDILGGMVSMDVGTIDVGIQTAVHVASGGTLNLFDAVILGDITIDVGGTLNCSIIEHIGTIINNGMINGTIGDGAGEITHFGNVSIIDSLRVGAAALEASAIVQFDSITRGFLMPRMTTAERDAIVSPVLGLEIYNTTAARPDFFNGVSWASVNGPAAPINSVQFNTPLGTFAGSANLIFDGDKLSIGGVAAPRNILHVQTFTAGVTGVTAGDTGILIGDNVAPRIMFEDTNGDATEKVMGMEYGNSILKVLSFSDDGTATDVDNILVINRNGNIVIGTGPLDVQTTDVATEAVIFTVTSQSGRTLSILQPDIADPDAPFVFQTNNACTFRVDAVDALIINDSGNTSVTGLSANTITITTVNDGDTLLSLNTPRRWEFQQEGTGAAAALRLRNTLGVNKNFFIDTDGVTGWRSVDGTTTLMNLNHTSGDLTLFSGGLNTNIVNKNTVYFTSEADLPTPVSGVITLQENTTYILYNDDPTASQKQVILTNEIAIPDAGGCRITSVGLATVLLVYTGTGTLFTTTDTFTGFLHIDEIFIAAPSGTLFNIDGVLPIGSEFFPRIFLSNMGFFNTDTIGTIKTISVNMNVGAFFSCKQGLVLDGIDEGLIGNWRFANWQNDAGSIMLTAKNSLRFPKVDGCTFETQSNETAFDIEPNIGDEPFIIAGNSYRGTGVRYLTGTSGTSTSYADASQAGTITAVSGTPFGESIMTDVVHGLVEGQVITTTGFADANYNGTFEVLEIIDADNFRIHTLFTATGTGSFTSDVLRVNSVAHGLSAFDGVQLIPDDFDTGYQGGYLIIAAITDSFFVNQIFNFTGQDTGAWNTDSLTETDPRMKVEGNAGLADSKILAFGEMNNNTNTTTVTQSVYTPINVAEVVLNAVSQRFVIDNGAVGRFVYIGQEDLSGEVLAIVSATKTGATANYKFSLSVNEVAPDFGSAPFSPMEVKTTKVSISVLQSMNIVTGDTIQIMIGGDGTGDDITITDFTINATD